MKSLRQARALAAILFVIGIASAIVSSRGIVDDLSDAWANVSTMIKFIGMGEASSTEEAGNRSLTSIEKAIDAQNDSDKKGKLRDALGEVRTAMSHARKSEWPYAEGAAKRALKLLEDVK